LEKKEQEEDKKVSDLLEQKIREISLATKASRTEASKREVEMKSRDIFLKTLNRPTPFNGSMKTLKKFLMRLEISSKGPSLGDRKKTILLESY
jgi:hypothetical protein